jgi:hypothetical protein
MAPLLLPVFCGLAHGKRIAPQVIAVEFDQVEGPHEHVRVMTAVADAIERRDAIGPYPQGAQAPAHLRPHT